MSRIRCLWQPCITLPSLRRSLSCFLLDGSAAAGPVAFSTPTTNRSAKWKQGSAHDNGKGRSPSFHKDIQ